MGWISLIFFSLITGFLPLSFIYLIGTFLGKLGYYLAFRQRKIALESLNVAFPDLSREVKERIVLDFFIFMVQGSLELFYYKDNTKKLQDVRIEGRHYLEEALQLGKGVIALSAHLSNFPLMAIKLAQEGYPMNVIARPMRHEKSGDYIHRFRTEIGVKTIFSYPRKQCVNKTLNVLRNNEIVMIQMDQNFGTGGVWVNFFGKLAATPVGPLVFARRSGAAIVPMYIIREGRGKYCIKMFSQENLEVADDKDELLLLNAIKFTQIIEGWVRQYPSQWTWIHRRWKSQPSEKMMQQKFKVQRQ
jgi:KDO2-lipid IV(A) lauroyltransferase